MICSFCPKQVPPATVQSANDVHLIAVQLKIPKIVVLFDAARRDWFADSCSTNLQMPPQDNLSNTDFVLLSHLDQLWIGQNFMPSNWCSGRNASLNSPWPISRTQCTVCLENDSIAFTEVSQIFLLQSMGDSHFAKLPACTWLLEYSRFLWFAFGWSWTSQWTWLSLHQPVFPWPAKFLRSGSHDPPNNAHHLAMGREFLKSWVLFGSRYFRQLWIFYLLSGDQDGNHQFSKQPFLPVLGTAIGQWMTKLSM